MPSSLSAGPIKTFIRISKKLSVLANAELNVAASGKLVLEPGPLPADADGVEGELHVNDSGVLYIHNGTNFVVVGSQV